MLLNPSPAAVSLPSSRAFPPAPTRMADDALTTSRPPRTTTTHRTGPSPTPAEAVVRGWRSSLRHQNQHSEQQPARSPSRGPPPPGSRRNGATARPTSGVSATTTRLSTNPSLLSLEQPPVSPTTSAASRHHPAYPGTAPRSPHLASQPQPASSSSSSQHPPQPPRQRYPSSSSTGARHAAQLHRVYDSPRYDADFDRGGGGGGGKLATTLAASAPALFDPDAPRPSPTTTTTTSNGHSVPERRRERELRDDGTTTTTTTRRPRSKREAVNPQDLGRKAVKESKESLESVETDFSGRTKSSSGGGGGGGGKKSRRRREGDGFDDAAGGGGGGGGGGAGEAGDAGSSRRQLFDPRRDDPTRFNSNGGSANHLPLPLPQRHNSASTGGRGAAAAGDARSVANMSVYSFNSVYSGTSDVTGGGVEADDSVSINTTSSGRLTANDPALANLKRAYREVMDLEKKLQDEHRAAMVAKDREDDEHNKGVRLHGATKTTPGKRDDEYWVRLASGHKQLADAHYSFLQLSLDPRLPAAYHALPQKYNIPTRLWQVAFHQLLERMRHAVLAAPFSTNQTSDSTRDTAPPANVLEHLIEFIQYAYGHYSQLFEDPTVAVFRAAWIEQLGDLARYRMAVAGLASRVFAAQQLRESLQHQQLTSNALTAGAQHDPPQESATPVRREDAASIGQAALNDWDLEEQETWREMARDWYAQGLAETPGTGRLQHHLALLSKGEGDELRGLYHYAKSLTAAHPYLSARESILPLFDQEHQSRRTLPEVGKSELFVHLHGMLFTKISLDDFDDCLGRFVERLQEEGWALVKGMDSHGCDSHLYGDKEWFMLAIVNLASMMQYGAEDGILKKLTTKEPTEKPSHHPRGHAANRAAPNKVAPQAIMLNSARQQQLDDEPDSDVVKRLAPSDPTSVDDDPLPFKLAQLLSFRLLEFTLSNPVRHIGPAAVVNPYLTLLVTFVGHFTFHPHAFKHLERAVPWDALVEFFNALPPTVEIRLDSPARLLSSRGTPLPEDWCLRGMEWAGRQLFGRGYWRTDGKKGPPRSGGSSHATESTLLLPPPIEAIDGTTLRVESELDALKFDLAALDNDDDGDQQGEDGLGTAVVLSEARWRRVAIAASWIVRNVPGFDYEPNVRGDESKFRISGPLRVKIERWRREDEDAKEAERLSQMSLQDRGGSAGEEDTESAEEEDDEDDEDENDSPAVKELKARRRQLKSVIRSARASRNTSSSSRKGSKLSAKAASLPKVFAGFTVLVFDTNILLTSIKLFSELVEAECWTIIVPLAVVTELDGLKRNATPLGIAAGEVIEYLERAIRTHARYLKIQTSRGNYLKDLAIRNESIDFAFPPQDIDAGTDALFSHDHARSMDDVILRAATWQKEHFTSRLALVNPRAIAERKKVAPETAQVVLVTFDRNLRLKARARQLDATDEKELTRVLETALVNGGG